MTRRIILHLGMNKSGSTAIQVAYAGYADTGIEWLRSGDFTHTQLVCLPFRERVPPAIWPSPDPARQAADRIAARQVLEAALAATSRSVILSSEFLSDYGSEAEVAALVDALRPHADRVEALVYLRDPAGFVASVYQQTLKVRLPAPDLSALFPRYRKRLAPWVRVLGRGAVTCRPYDPAAWEGGNLLRDFARHVGIAQRDVPNPGLTANQALSAEATAALYAYRLTDPQPAPNPAARRARNRMVFALKGYGTRGFRFGAAALAAPLAQFADHVDWAESQMGRPFPRADADGARVLSSPGDLALLAAEGTGALRDWLARAEPEVQLTGDTPAALLAALVAHYEANP